MEWNAMVKDFKGLHLIEFQEWIKPESTIDSKFLWHVAMQLHTAETKGRTLATDWLKMWRNIFKANQEMKKIKCANNNARPKRAAGVKRGKAREKLTLRWLADNDVHYMRNQTATLSQKDTITLSRVFLGLTDFANLSLSRSMTSSRSEMKKSQSNLIFEFTFELRSVTL